MSQVRKSYTIGGKQLSSEKNIDTIAEIVRQKDIPIAYEGNLTTRTDDNTGVITLDVVDAGDNFVATDRVDVYWEVAGVKGHRRGMKVSSVASEAITVGTAGGDEGLGDNFPIATTPVQLAKSLVYDFRFDGSDAAILAFQVDARAIIVLTGDDDAEDYAQHFQSAMADGWDSESGEANPIAGDVITKVYISHNNIEEVKSITVGVGLSS